MLTGKQRAKLRGLANTMDTIIQIGKTGVTDAVIIQTAEALEVREMVKLRVLETAGVTAREAAQEIAEGTGADIVQVIGTRFVLFKQNADPAKRSIFPD